jgi:hypothetical protein
MRLAVWAHLDDDPVDQLNSLLIERARVDDPAVVLGIKTVNGKLGGESSHMGDVRARARKPLTAPLVAVIDLACLLVRLEASLVADLVDLLGELLAGSLVALALAGGYASSAKRL